MEARLRGLAARLERMSPKETHHVMTWLQPHAEQSLAESDLVLEGIDAET